MAERVKSSAVAAPDGGWGWMIVAGCFITTMCTRAITRCVSIFFVEFHKHFSSDYSTTAWIYSLVDCTTMLCAPLGSYIGTRLSCRVAVMAGGLLSSAGLILSSFAPSLEYLYLSLGILTGLGFALSYTPAIAMVGTYFSERKALAYGIAMSGSGIGTFVLAPVVQLLIELYSWRGALLILGGLVSHLCVCGALMRPLERQKQTPSGKDRVALLNSQLSAELRMEMNLEGPPKKVLEWEELSGSANIFRMSNGEEEKPEEEQQESLLKSGEVFTTDSNQEEAKFIDSSQRNSILKGIRNQGESMKEPVDSDMEENLNGSKNPNGSNFDLESKLTDSKLLCEMPFCKSLCFSIKNNPTESKGSFCLPSIEEYSFLLIPEFLLLALSFLFLAFGCSVPFVYLVPYSQSVGVCHQQAALLMSILGGMGIVGNITFGWISDIKHLRVYRKASYLFAVGLEGLGCLFVPLLRTFSLLVPFALVYGYFDGACVALIPVVISDIVGPAYLSSALGIVHFLHAIPYLISPPIGGWLVDQTGSYTAVFFLSGFSLIFSSLILAIVTLALRCKRRPSQPYPG